MNTNDYGMAALSAEEMEAIVGGSDGYMAEKIGYALGWLAGTARSLFDGVDLSTH